MKNMRIDVDYIPRTANMVGINVKTFFLNEYTRDEDLIPCVAFLRACFTFDALATARAKTMGVTHL